MQALCTFLSRELLLDFKLFGGRVQGWNSKFGSNKERKKDSRQGKKTPSKDFNKSA